MENGLPGPATSAAPNQWTMDNIALNDPNKKKKTGKWSFGAGKLNAKDGWFKNPRDTSWTIDSAVNGKKNPSGYDSNTLITVVRSSQCFCALMTIILYIATMSAPSKWLMILAAAAGVLSAIWSMLALWLRHLWSIWLVIVEILVAVAWIVLYSANSVAKPDALKSETFRVATIAIEASMVLWIQTGLLMVTPFFHKLGSWILQKHRSRKAAKPREAVPDGVELPSHPKAIYTVPQGDVVSPQPRPYGTAPSAPYAGSSKTSHGLLERTLTRDTARTVSPVSMSSVYREAADAQPVSPLSTTSHRQVPVDLGDRPQRASVNPWDTTAPRREERQWV
ncbi:hypothetical protein Hte_000609 [Hypoxylon texense]